MITSICFIQFFYSCQYAPSDYIKTLFYNSENHKTKSSRVNQYSGTIVLPHLSCYAVCPSPAKTSEVLFSAKEAKLNNWTSTESYSANSTILYHFEEYKTYFIGFQALSGLLGTFCGICSVSRGRQLTRQSAKPNGFTSKKASEGLMESQTNHW